jgi:hypothetical protein
MALSEERRISCLDEEQEHDVVFSALCTVYSLGRKGRDRLIAIDDCYIKQVETGFLELGHLCLIKTKNTDRKMHE